LVTQLPAHAAFPGTLQELESAAAEAPLSAPVSPIAILSPKSPSLSKSDESPSPAGRPSPFRKPVEEHKIDAPAEIPALSLVEAVARAEAMQRVNTVAPQRQHTIKKATGADRAAIHALLYGKK
jgi:hypothetical protein